jgi:hypothetical protein
VGLLQRILERIETDLDSGSGVVGLAVTVHDKGQDIGPSVVAAVGAGAEIVDVQLSGAGGPVVDALQHQVPVLSLDLWTDERWPDLTFDTAVERAPQHRADWQRVHGAVAVPGIFEQDSTVVVSCTLADPASAATVATLIGYEQLVSAALLTTAAENAAAFDDVLTALQSRGAIEQAKGALMGLVGCDADEAWNMLRRASQELNVKLRELAVALLEHISGAPAEQPDAAVPIAPNAHARRAAGLLWAALSEPEPQQDSS